MFYLYVVFYAVIGSRCTGSYLVKAEDATHAKKVVKRIDSDYILLEAMPVETACEEYDEDLDGFLAGIDKIPQRMGQYTLIESGT